MDNDLVFIWCPRVDLTVLIWISPWFPSSRAVFPATAVTDRKVFTLRSQSQIIFWSEKRTLVNLILVMPSGYLKCVNLYTTHLRIPSWLNQYANSNSDTFFGNRDSSRCAQQMINKHTDRCIIRNTFLPCRDSEFSNEIDMCRLYYVML